MEGSVISCDACGDQNSSRSIRCLGCGAELAGGGAVSVGDRSLAGERVGPYLIEGLLGAGSRASVYRATHVALNRRVALKVLGTELASDERARARFIREGRALALVDHPHVVVVHDVGEVDQRPFIAMNLHEGDTLRARIARGALPIEEGVGIARALASALAAIHDQGIVHRDLKPENVVFPREGGMKLVDFGLVRVDERHGPVETTLTLPGAVLGTLPYLAPEQLLAEKADARADLWALGVVLFEMLAGTTPFDTDDQVGSILERGPRSLRELRPVVPSAVAEIVSKLLSRSRDDRPASAREVESMLVVSCPSLIPPSVRSLAEPLAAGQVVGDRLRLVAEIGRGGAGAVWRADHLVLGSPCAIKFLLEDAALLARTRSRFVEEARTLAKLHSPHIVRVLDAGTYGGRPYLAMELLDGETLEALSVRAGPLPGRRALEILSQIASGLDEAHQHGVVHRDLKPANVFLADTQDGPKVKLLDFGIAKSVGETEGSTHGGSLMGTPEYMSPEQIQPKGAVDLRTDVWSLGVTAFRVLSGKVPYTGATLTAVCDDILSGRVPSLHEAAPHLPQEVDAWFATAVAPDPSDRFASAGEMVRRLQSLMGDLPGIEDDGKEVEPPTVPLRNSSPTMTRILGGTPRLGPAQVAGIVAGVLVIALLGALAGLWLMR